jgi:hypothetical protein
LTAESGGLRLYNLAKVIGRSVTERVRKTAVAARKEVASFHRNERGDIFQQLLIIGGALLILVALVILFQKVIWPNVKDQVNTLLGTDFS